MSEETVPETEGPRATRPIDAMPIDVSFINMCYEGLRVCRELSVTTDLPHTIKSKARDLSDTILQRLQDIFANPGA
jgi:hypothetical protein